MQTGFKVCDLKIKQETKLVLRIIFYMHNSQTVKHVVKLKGKNINLD